jgi:hypothetical protein
MFLNEKIVSNVERYDAISGPIFVLWIAMSKKVSSQQL